MFADDALLLIGHGSARYTDAAAALQRHAAALRAGARFRQVEVGLLNGTPSMTGALARIEAASIRAVPFFMEDGYFTRVAIPAAIQADSRVTLCPPVGTHDENANVIADRAGRACAERGIPPSGAAVLLVGHGSARAPGRALALHRHASRIAAGARFARFEAACLEEPPLLADALAGLRDYPVIVIGFFANAGTHARDDVPRAVATERDARGRDGRNVHFHGVFTDDPAMTRIILCQAGSTGVGGE
jgi:sirohydrochlorin cobaltochelatase